MKLDKAMQIWFGSVIAYMIVIGMAALGVAVAIILAVLLYFGVI